MEQLHTDRTLNKPRDIPARAEEIATDARVKLNETVQAVSGRARDAARYTDQVVQANPWTSVGVGSSRCETASAAGLPRPPRRGGGPMLRQLLVKARCATISPDGETVARKCPPKGKTLASTCGVRA